MNHISKNIKNKKIETNNDIRKIRSLYILKKILNNLSQRKFLKIIKYNNQIKKRLQINLNDYIEFSKIEIEIIPAEDKSGKIINFLNKGDKNYIHIFYNNTNEQKRKKYLLYKKKDKINKIRIIINHQIKSFSKLFYYCCSIESIEFKKFYRNNVTDMSGMFYECSSLKELDLNNFNTNNVTDMNGMFSGC